MKKRKKQMARALSKNFQNKVDFILCELEILNSHLEIEKFLNATLLELVSEYVNDNTFKQKMTQLIREISIFADTYEPCKNLQSVYAGHNQYHGVSYLRKFKTRADVFQLNLKNETETEKNETETETETVKTIDCDTYFQLIEKLLNSKNWYEIGLGIAAVTGRRITEVFLLGEFKPDQKNTLFFRGVLKHRDDHTSWYRIASLINSKKVVEAYKKMIEIRNLSLNKLSKDSGYSRLEKLFDVEENGDFFSQVAENFNKNYAKSYGLAFKNSGLRDFISVEKNNNNSKNVVHSLRAVYATIIEQYFLENGSTIQQTLKKTQSIMIHQNVSNTLIYSRFKSQNTPNLNLDGVEFGEVTGIELKSILEFENEKQLDLFGLNGEVTGEVTGEVIGEVNREVNGEVTGEVTGENLESLEIQVLKKLPIDFYPLFGELINEYKDLNGVFTFLMSQYQSKVQIEKTLIPNNRLIISRLIEAIFEYNNNIVDKNMGVAVTGAFINKLALMCGLHQFENKLLQDCLTSLDYEIKNNLEKNRLVVASRLLNGKKQPSNTHLRGDTMLIVLKQISKIYEKMQFLL
ncbi:MAG: hypothetical protein B7C55_12315 [Actinomycetales bacterium mxb001]|nr:MAG: hypothetical protein B7C55_12315 [Actinomycetales bacterium mxb001]